MVTNTTTSLSFESLLFVILLTICTCTYIHAYRASLLDSNKRGLRGLLWKSARIGERLSPYVSLCCIAMAFRLLFFSSG
ncbi:hypothetical protein AKO1_007905 [Acrasis kona]|uniref:Protein kish n=1 Tax=Acrasis kona TaxID=1008807 RepID=A0AAW2YQ80_9EUKA